MFKGKELYVITGTDFSNGRSTGEVVREALAGGAGIIQLREKEWTTRQLFDAGREIRKITKEYGALFIVNDRIDVALAVEADGVHLGQKDMPADIARKLIGPEKILGISAETLEEALRAENDGADYIGLGPVYGTQTKLDTGGPCGLELLDLACKKINIPIYAIGGIKAHNTAEVIKAGAFGVAVVTEVISANDIRGAAKRLNEIISRVKEESS